MSVSMSRERWRQITRIFHAARTRRPDERDSFLATACGADAALRRDVDQMLAADEAAGRVGDEELARQLLDVAAALTLAPGEQLGRYHVTEALGVGGMGEVYRAHDPQLNRDVAIKILPPTFAVDAERLARFRREARVLATLNHPHIAAIYDIATGDAPEHLILELVDGDTLRGPTGIAPALEYARQIAEALSAAHAKGIVHRDLKPANVKVTPEGTVKVLDFGLAHDTRDSADAVPGVLIGSPAYMSPEQARGEHVDERTDVWAFGCLLYELLAGSQAFRGESLTTTIEAVQYGEPDWTLLPRTTPAAVRRLIQACVAKDPEQRPRSIDDVRRTIIRIQRYTGRWRLAAAAVAAVVIAALGTAIVTQHRAAEEQWARNVGIPRVIELAASDNYSDAFALALEIERRVPADPIQSTLWPRFSSEISLVTEPEGADVYNRPYAARPTDWSFLGRTPIRNLRLPLGVFQLRIEKDGYEPQMLAAANPSTLLGNATNRLAAPMLIRLPVADSFPGMVAVPGGPFPVSLNAFSTTDPIPLDPYFIDKYEVTNAQFQTFVDAGGYAHHDYWDGLTFEKDGRIAPWTEAMAWFRDPTGAPGPATWASGRYPPGGADLPVAGISWYEAVAYCRHRGAALPTVYHWRRAALSPDEMFAPLAPAIIAASNFEGNGLAAAGHFGGLGPYGTYDMAGNVREWSWNEAQPGARWIQGGAWSDPQYMLVVPDRAPAFDRSPTNGFRCARYPDPIADALLNPIVRRLRDNRTAAGVGDDTFEIFRRQLLPVNAPLNHRVEFTDASNPDWIKQKISFDAGSEEDRASAYLFLPKRVPPPYQVVVYFPGRSSFIGRQSSTNLQPDFLDFVVRSGRALAWPVYKGSYERWIPTSTPSADVRRILLHWRHDLSRVIDVIERHPDLDAGRLAYLGLSYGATAPLPLLALEERLSAAVLLSAGLGALPGAPESDSLNYVSRITIPLLLLSGRQDFVFPLETAAIPLFERLGTTADRKRHVIFDAGHMMFPRGPMTAEILDWLDRYLGSTGKAPIRFLPSAD